MFGLVRRGALTIAAIAAIAGCDEPRSASTGADGEAGGSVDGSSSGGTMTEGNGEDGGAGDGGAGDGGAGDGGAGDGGSDDWIVLFDGQISDAWRMSTIENQPGQDDPGSFSVIEGELVAQPGTDLGLLWHSEPTPPSFVLSLEWALSAPDDNSGVFLRFPHPDSKGYDNTAWVAIDFGFEVQIDETGAPDGAPVHTTGAIYGQPDQQLSPVPARPIGEWNQYEIRADGQVYTVTLNGAQVTRFENTSLDRGQPTNEAAPAFIGLQAHTGHVRFRNIRMQAL
jgi:hypothetical protein